MAKHGIRAPKAPKGEDPAITMANQDLQIKVLIDRCEELRKERDSLQRFLDESRNANKSMFEQCGEMADAADRKEKANTRLLGFQDCAREVIKMMVEK